MMKLRAVQTLVLLALVGAAGCKSSDDAAAGAEGVGVSTEQSTSGDDAEPGRETGPGTEEIRPGVGTEDTTPARPGAPSPP